MVDIKFYIEYHYGVRRPNLDFFVNDSPIVTNELTIISTKAYQEDIIVNFQSALLDTNHINVVMKDKTNDDLLFTGTEFVDHWVKIRELEVDGIKFDFMLYESCSFHHKMSDEWVEDMKKNGHTIPKIFPKSTEIRLNGILTVDFDYPVWEWYVKKLLYI